MSEDDSVLGERWVRQHLVARGLIQADVLIRVVPLVGGVSSDIVAVSGRGIELVVKRALPRLRVEQEWIADASRAITEGRALQLAHRFVPDAVPEVVDLDEEAMTLVLERAPRSWTNWRDDLLSRTVDPSVGKRLGETVGIWHRETAGALAPADTLGNLDSFVELRIDPFFRSVGQRHPEIVARIDDVVERLLTTKHCLVHGDLSPKNVLTGEAGQWVLDWETAHVGDPVFDLAFLIAHLVLKAEHRSASAKSFRAVAHAFLDGYQSTDSSPLIDDNELAETVACLLLARVDGKSPADYLSSAGRAHIRALALDALLSSPLHILRTWVLA